MKRSIVRIELDPGAKDVLERVRKELGMTQVSLLSRLVTWFAKQDRAAQTSVVSGFSEAAATELARLLANKKAG